MAGKGRMGLFEGLVDCEFPKSAGMMMWNLEGERVDVGEMSQRFEDITGCDVSVERKVERSAMSVMSK